MLLFALLGFISYANVLNGEFFFDDEDLITDNRYIQSFDITKIYSSHLIEGANRKGNFYRPHQAFIIATVWAVFGENPVPFHLIGIVLHILNAWLLLGLFLKLKLPPGPSLAGAALWLVHPVQTEAVSFISGFHDPAATALLFGALRLFLAAQEQAATGAFVNRLLMSLFLFVNGLLFKESLVVFAPMCLIISLYYFPRRQWFSGRFITSLGVMAVLTGGYLWLKFTVLNFWDIIGLTEGISNPYTQNLWLRLTTFVNIQWEYLKLLFWPAKLYFFKPYIAYSSLWAWRAWPGVLMLLGTAGAMVYFKRSKIPFLGSCWFFAALIPYSGIIPLKDMYLEHWLYLPLIGIIILMIWLVQISAKKIPTTVLLAVLLICLAACMMRTIQRNRDWADGERFYNGEVKNNLDKCRAFSNLALYYHKRERYPEAIQAGLKSASFLKPRESRGAFIHYKLGLSHKEAGQLQNAEDAYFKSLEYNPNYQPSLLMAGQLYREKGHFIKAMMMKQLLDKAMTGEKLDRSRIRAVRTIIEAG